MAGRVDGAVRQSNMRGSGRTVETFDPSMIEIDFRP